jgi:hypothetical protein
MRHVTPYANIQYAIANILNKKKHTEKKILSFIDSASKLLALFYTKKGFSLSEKDLQTSPYKEIKKNIDSIKDYKYIKINDEKINLY